MLSIHKKSQQIVNSLTFEFGNDVYKIEWLKNYIHQRFILKKNGAPKYTLSGFIRFGFRTIKDEKEEHEIAMVECKKDGYVTLHWKSEVYYWSINCPNISTLRKDSPDGPLILSWNSVNGSLEFGTEFKSHSYILELALLSLFCGAQRLSYLALAQRNSSGVGFGIAIGAAASIH